jgi:uncharacterized protein (UPF0335 family)
MRKAHSLLQEFTNAVGLEVRGSWDGSYDPIREYLKYSTFRKVRDYKVSWSSVPQSGAPEPCPSNVSAMRDILERLLATYLRGESASLVEQVEILKQALLTLTMTALDDVWVSERDNGFEAKRLMSVITSRRRDTLTLPNRKRDVPKGRG